MPYYIHAASVAAGGVGAGLAQIPGGDNAVIIPIQLTMTISLGKFADIGIANYISNLVTVPKDGIEGMLTETFAYTELNRLYQMPMGKKMVRSDKSCFSICGNYELDFVVVDKNDFKFGLEIKTGNSR